MIKKVRTEKLGTEPLWGVNNAQIHFVISWKNGFVYIKFSFVSQAHIYTTTSLPLK